jgi:hypothetical protein
MPWFRRVLRELQWARVRPKDNLKVYFRGVYTERRNGIMRFAKVLALNLLLTVLECGLFGPAASKLDSSGLRGWAARTPFYLLPLYLTPAVLLWPRLSQSYFRTGLVGAMLTLPSALWVIAAKCPLPEAMAHLTIGCTQGVILASVTQRLHFTVEGSYGG